MGFFLRHRVLFGITALVLSVAVTFGICFFALSKTAAQALRLTVVIDAGHGGIDGGVTGKVTGTKESDINLSISRYLQKEFEDAGFLVVQTRLSEAGLYGTTAKGYKKRDMKKRAEIINAAAPALVISVHQNFFSLSSRRGAQVFFKKGFAPSVALADCIQDSLNAMEECPRQSEPLAGDYFILNCHEYPAVIVECGFLSNAQDEALLVNESYQKKIAKTIRSGAVAFLASGANTSG